MAFQRYFFSTMNRHHMQLVKWTLGDVKLEPPVLVAAQPERLCLHEWRFL